MRGVVHMYHNECYVVGVEGCCVLFHHSDVDVGSGGGYASLKPGAKPLKIYGVENIKCIEVPDEVINLIRSRQKQLLDA